MAIAAMTACNSDDDFDVVPEAIVPSSIEFKFSDNLLRLIYTDDTGADVLPLIKGESLTLGYTMLPDTTTFRDVTWTTSNADVVSVDNNGKIVALSSGGAGYSMIQVAPEAIYSGSGINASLKVTVSDELVEAKKITISSSADELYAGNTLHLSASIAPTNATYKTVKWDVSDSNIATIDNKGVLTAKESSSTKTAVTVRATALDDSGVSDTKVIMVRQTVQPQSVTIDQSYSADNGYYCAINEKSVTLGYTPAPADCTTSLIEWTSSDETIATVDHGKVTFNQRGNFGEVTITATCPATGNSSSVKLNIPAGLIRELYHDQNNYSWYNSKQSGNGTESSHTWNDGYITITTYTQNATKQRADIKCWDKHTWLHVGNYPIFAIKMDDVKDKGAKSRNINIDAVGTSASGTQYKALANGNNKYLHDYKCSDGSHIFIYDFSSQSCGTGGLMPTNEVVDFTTMQVKYADMDGLTSQTQYNVYWVQTFKSLSDLKNYVKSEGLTYDIVK